MHVLEHATSGKPLKSLSSKHLQSAYLIFIPRSLLPNGAKPTVKDQYIQLLLPEINRRIAAGFPLALPPQPEDDDRDECSGDIISSGSDGDTTRHQPRARLNQENQSDSE